MPQFTVTPDGRVVPASVPQLPSEELSMPEQYDDEESNPTLDELERTDIDDVVTAEPTHDEDDSLAELERTDIDDVVSMDEKPAKPKAPPRRLFRRTNKPVTAVSLQGIR